MHPQSPSLAYRYLLLEALPDSHVQLSVGLARSVSPARPHFLRCCSSNSVFSWVCTKWRARSLDTGLAFPLLPLSSWLLLTSSSQWAAGQGLGEGIRSSLEGYMDSPLAGRTEASNEQSVYEYVDVQRRIWMCLEHSRRMSLIARTIFGLSLAWESDSPTKLVHVCSSV